MARPGVFVTTFWCEVRGAGNLVGAQMLHNCARLHAAFQQDGPGAGRRISPWSAVPLSWELDGAAAIRYADVVKKTVGEFELALLPGSVVDHSGWLTTQIFQSTKRYCETRSVGLAVDTLRGMVSSMVAGGEHEHLRELIRYVDQRGSDVHLWSDAPLRELRQQAPYPAFLWDWAPRTSYRWKWKQHISVLEVLAVVNHVTQSFETPGLLSQRFFHVVDSQVAAAVISKGRSSSKQLNFLLRKLAGLILAGDAFPLMLWTLSKWNFADLASRKFAAPGVDE